MSQKQRPQAMTEPVYIAKLLEEYGSSKAGYLLHVNSGTVTANVRKGQARAATEELAKLIWQQRHSSPSIEEGEAAVAAAVQAAEAPSQTGPALYVVSVAETQVEKMKRLLAMIGAEVEEV